MSQWPTFATYLLLRKSGSRSAHLRVVDVKAKLACCDRAALLGLEQDLYVARKDNQFTSPRSIRFGRERFGVLEENHRPPHREHTFSDLFVAHLLTRNIRYEEDLVDQLFNSSEKRLARVLLMLAHFGKEGIPETVVPKISQETLAEMVGTTRSRVSFFMNRFRKLGFIHYAGGEEGGLQVHSSLLNVVLHD